MASVFTHSIVAVLFGKLLRRGKIPMPIWIFAILCSMAPDIDVLGLSMGVGYGDFLGHRGFTHSLCFAFILGLLVVWVGFSGAPGLVGSHWQLALFFFMITSSHGLLDAMTNGGLGVAFFSPFDTGRYFLPWRPIEVSPIGVTSFLSRRGADVLITEMQWICGPLLVLLAFKALWSRTKESKNRGVR